ncbi:MAG: peptidyl-tRNA hydrolase, family [Candidatus Atribacteria bacterium]|nr:peptidyl-tRNA hydrolase, family [Candidatus Atribacteria bacterium]
MILVVGLGNPKEKYRYTRHNLGFWVVDRLAAELGWRWKQKVGYCYTTGKINGKEVWLVKPKTFMNASGEGLALFLRDHPLAFSQMVVVHDEVDFPPGVVKIKPGGGTAGHRGLQSLVQFLGNSDFTRVRVGIGKPDDRRAIIEHVLGEPAGEEKKILNRAADRACQAVIAIVKQGVEKAMNEYNSSSL